MEEIVENPNMVYLLEEFELIVITKMVDYIKTCNNPAEDLKVKNDYFGKHIKESLLVELVDRIRAREDNMSKEEILKWLTISCNQFQESPASRFEILQEKYLKQYFTPYRVPGEGNDLENSLNNFVNALNGYIKHYPNFVEVTCLSLDSYKKQYYGLDKNSNTSQSSELKKKLKTNLTVKEIAYLFKALHEEGIIEAKHKTAIFNFIADSFSSKQQEDISVKSIKNAFDTPNFHAVDFWQEKFTHFMQKARKDKENLSQ